MRNLSRHLLLALGLSLALACGQSATTKKDPPKDPQKGATTQAASEPTPDPTAVVSPEIFDKLPSSTALAVALLQPQKSLAGALDLFQKTGVSFGGPEMKKGLDEMKADLGFDPFDPGFLTKIGVDGEKGAAFALDGQPVSQYFYEDAYAALVEERRDVMPYLVFSLKDPKAFDTWWQGFLSRLDPGLTAAEEMLGDIKALFFSRDGGKHIDFVMLSRENLLYLLFPDVRKIDSPQSKQDLSALLKESIKRFSQNLKDPLSKEPRFQEAITRVKPTGDVYFFLDTERVITLIEETEKTTLTYLAPKDEATKKTQDEKRKYNEERAEEEKEEFQVIKTITGLFPYFALSGVLSSDSFSLGGELALSKSAQKQAEAIFSTKGASPPPYGTLFPEDTFLFYRYSLSPAALKEELFSLFSGGPKAELEKLFQEAKGGVLAASGLDLEEDILKAATGELAIGFSGLSSISNRIFIYLILPPTALFITPFSFFGTAGFFLLTNSISARDMIPVLIALQMKSPAAAEKIMGGLDKALEMAKAAGLTTTRKGDIRVLTVPGGGKGRVFAFTSSGDLLLGGTSEELVSDALARQKTPGASFADRIGGALVKDLVGGKGATGSAMNLSGAIAKYAEQLGKGRETLSSKSKPDGTIESKIEIVPPSAFDLELKEILLKLSAKLGAQTTNVSYEDGAISYRFEVTLR